MCLGGGRYRIEGERKEKKILEMLGVDEWQYLFFLKTLLEPVPRASHFSWKGHKWARCQGLGLGALLGDLLRMPWLRLISSHDWFPAEKRPTSQVNINLVLNLILSFIINHISHFTVGEDWRPICHTWNTSTILANILLFGAYRVLMLNTLYRLFLILTLTLGGI